MHGLAALCHEARKGGDTGSRSTYPMARLLSTRCLGEKLKKASMTENAMAKEIVDAAFRIQTTLGPGWLESVYDTVLAYELGRRGLRTVRPQPIPVVYASDLSPARRQASWVADQLPRTAPQRGHHAHCQRPRRR